jgi:hypothetical protein
MWHVLFVSFCSCSVPSGSFFSVLFHCQVLPCPFPLGMMILSWNVLHGVPAQRRSSARGERGGLRALAWPTWLPIGMMLFVLLSCARGKMVSWL